MPNRTTYYRNKVWKRMVEKGYDRDLSDFINEAAEIMLDIEDGVGLREDDSEED